jgi:hypothetical protein
MFSVDVLEYLAAPGETEMTKGAGEHVGRRPDGRGSMGVQVTLLAGMPLPD